MSAEEQLAADLRAAGVSCAVEARDRLAVLRMRAGGPDAERIHEQLADAAARAAVVRLARGRGFSHVALELADDPADTDDRAPVRRD